MNFDIGSRDAVATFTTHSDMRELKSSMLAAATLAELSGGLVFDEDTGGVLPGARLLDEARSIVL